MSSPDDQDRRESGPPGGEPPEPPWQLLPAEPAKFFGLPSGFHRKDLKRAYNNLLRCYKPDKFPQEFKKLRAAFEQLDGQLRYGEKDQTSSDSNALNWNASAADDASNKDALERSSDSKSTEPPRDPATNHSREISDGKPTRNSRSVIDRIDSEPMEQLYAELAQQPEVPFDYYALALLSDYLFEPSEHRFLHWLIDGLKRFPEQPALSQLLVAYLFNTPIADADLPSILLRVADCFRTDRFFYVTEKLFDRLLTSSSWSQFKIVLDGCSNRITDHHVRSRVTFTCHLLRRAMWVAPIEDCKSMVEYLNQHHEYLSDNLEFEFELNLRMMAYCEQRDRFVSKGKIAAMIDAALKRYCTATDGRADHEVVTVQVYIAEHPEELFREFIFSDDDDMRALVSWIWITEEVEERLETQLPPPQIQRLVAATLQMMQQIDHNFPAGPVQMYELLLRGIPVLIVFTTAVLMPFGVGYLAGTSWPQADGYITPTAFVIGAIVAAWYWFRLQKQTTSLWMAQYLRRLLLKHYQRWWRSLIGRYFAATQYHYRDADRAIDLLVDKHSELLKVSCWLPHFYARDVALYVYSAAVRFLR